MESALIFSSGAATLGVASHLVLYIRGEWERDVLIVAVRYATFAGLMMAYMMEFRQQAFDQSLRMVGTLYASYVAGLFGSICCYRLLLHPLSSFPGPFGAKLTAFWSVGSSVPGLKFHEKVQALHRTYGDFVRIRELAFFVP